MSESQSNKNKTGGWNTVKDYLSTLGVDASRMRTVSYGEERPFDAGHDDASWAKNRRAHLVLVGK